MIYRYRTLLKRIKRLAHGSDCALYLHDLMANEETWPEERMRGEIRCWEHSDIKNLSYPYVYKFFECLVRGY